MKILFIAAKCALQTVEFGSQLKQNYKSWARIGISKGSFRLFESAQLGHHFAGINSSAGTTTLILPTWTLALPLVSMD